MSALTYYSDTTDINYSETLVPLRATCSMTVTAEKYLLLLSIVDHIMIRISKKLSDSIHKTELFLSRSVHTIQFLHSIIKNSIFFGKHTV